jgi:cobalamin synthase
MNIHPQRIIISVAFMICGLSFTFPWLNEWNMVLKGIHYGEVSLFTVLVYVLLLVVTLIDIAERPMSKKRFAIIGVLCFSCMLMMSYFLYSKISRIGIDNLWDRLRIGLYLFYSSNFFIFGYSFYCFNKQFKIPETNEELLDDLVS